MRASPQVSQAAADVTLPAPPSNVDLSALIVEGINLIQRLIRMHDKVARKQEGLAFLAKILQALV